jgi:DNA-binding MarR family transcriptional regulator
MVAVSSLPCSVVYRKALSMALPQQYRLSSLQLAILHSLYADRRRQSSTTAGIPYSDIVQALKADKPSVTAGLRQLMRKGLVLLTLPRGGWTRYVTLTEAGKACAKTLPRPEQRYQSQVDAYELIALARQEREWQAADPRRERRRDKPQKREKRRSRHRGE